jgi:hypothetical protein
VFLTAPSWEGRHSMLYDIDSRNAVRKLVADLPVPDLGFVIQNDGKPRFAYGADENAEALLMRYDDAGKRWEKDRRIWAALRAAGLSAPTTARCTSPFEGRRPDR